MGQRAFVNVWCARLFGTTGNQMLLVALGWQMYELTGSAWDLGLVGLYQFVPALVLTLPAGHVADRLQRIHIVACCLFAQLLMALLLMAGSVQLSGSASWVAPWTAIRPVTEWFPAVSRELLLGLSVIVGVVRAFQMPAQQSLTPLLVPQVLLARATAFSAAGIQAAVVGGPALGGLIFAAGASMVYATCAVLSLIGFVLMLRLNIRIAPAKQEPTTWATLFAGVKFVLDRKLLLGALSLDLLAGVLGGATALLPMFAKDILHVGPMGLGFLRSAPAVGALFISIVLARWPLKTRVGPKLLMAVAAYGAAMMVFAVSESFLLSMLMLAFSGAADMVNVVVRQTLVQLETPDAMRGRVSAVNSIFIGASNQLGEFESGVTAAWWGPVGSVMVGGVATLMIAAIWWKLFPSIAQRNHMVEPRT